MYLNHITLNTGHIARTSRADVAPEVTTLLSSWLPTIINSGQYHPLPMPAMAQYSAQAFVQDGGLVVTVYGPEPDIGPRLPWVTFGVAHKSRHAESLWCLLVANFGAHPAAKRPSIPWCAVAVLPTAPLDPKILGWLADFERCVAWARVTRNPELRAVNDKP